MALDDLLQRLLDDARADAGRDARRRRRVFQALAEESATLQGTLHDLAERHAEVVVRTTAGHQFRGRVRAAARDFVIVATDAGDHWIALEGLETVRPAPEERQPPATGDRTALDLTLVEALGRVAPERPMIAVNTASGESVLGTLRAVGEDVVTVELDGPLRPACYVSSASVLVVAFRSG